LGVTKAMTAFLSGEMRDTVELVSIFNLIRGSISRRAASCRVLGSGEGKPLNACTVKAEPSVLFPKRAGKIIQKVARRQLHVGQGRHRQYTYGNGV
jgi:hypothetical protein